MKKFKYWREAALVAAGVFVIAVNFLFIGKSIPILAPVINVVGGLIISVPPTLVIYGKYKAGREIEEQFVLFVRDLTDSLESGMTLPLALNHCSKQNYYALNRHVNLLSSQVDWGIPFRQALETFGKSVRSLPVKRAVTTIIKTYEAGGKMSDTLNAVIKSLTTIEKIKKERSSSVRSQAVTFYIIYFVFIFILVIMQVFLVPALSSQDVSSISVSTEAIGISPTLIDPIVFVYFIIIQGFFAGLAIGKMAEGYMIAGLKHSVFLIIAGYAVFSLAIQFKVSFV